MNCRGSVQCSLNCDSPINLPSSPHHLQNTPLTCQACTTHVRKLQGKPASQGDRTGVTEPSGLYLAVGPLPSTSALPWGAVGHTPAWEPHANCSGAVCSSGHNQPTVGWCKKGSGSPEPENSHILSPISSQLQKNCTQFLTVSSTDSSWQGQQGLLWQSTVLLGLGSSEARPSLLQKGGGEARDVLSPQLCARGVIRQVWQSPELHLLSTAPRCAQPGCLCTRARTHTHTDACTHTIPWFQHNKHFPAQREMRSSSLLCMWHFIQQFFQTEDLTYKQNEYVCVILLFWMPCKRNSRMHTIHQSLVGGEGIFVAFPKCPPFLLLSLLSVTANIVWQRPEHACCFPISSLDVFWK